MKLAALLQVIFSLSSVSCGQPVSSNMSTPAPPVAAPPAVGCELKLIPVGAHFLITFVLSNPNPQPKVIHYFYPFIDFTIRVTAGGSEIPTAPYEYEGPQAPKSLNLPPNGIATLETPVRLVFEPQASRASYTWTILGSPPVDLVATLKIDGERILPCTASIAAL